MKIVKIETEGNIIVKTPIEVEILKDKLNTLIDNLHCGKCNYKIGREHIYLNHPNPEVAFAWSCKRCDDKWNEENTDNLRDALRDNDKFCESIIEQQRWLDDECMDKLNEYLNDLDAKEVFELHSRYVRRRND